MMTRIALLASLVCAAFAFCRSHHCPRALPAVRDPD
jgi:hypothetical protein